MGSSRRSIVVRQQQQQLSIEMSATPAQVYDLLSSSLSCLARLAMLAGGSPLADALQQAADRATHDAAEIDQSDDQPSLNVGDDFKTMRHARKSLDKISDSLDEADVNTASSTVMQMCTAILQRHNKARKQFFTTGRAAQQMSPETSTEPDDPDMADRCSEAVGLLDAVAPQIRAHFQRLSEEDDKLKAIQFVEHQQRQQHEHRLERIARAETMGRANQQRKREHRRRAKEEQAQSLAAELVLQREARTQYEAFHEAKVTRHAAAEKRVAAVRRERHKILKDNKLAATQLLATQEIDEPVSKATTGRIGGQLRSHHM